MTSGDTLMTRTGRFSSSRTFIVDPGEPSTSGLGDVSGSASSEIPRIRLMVVLSDDRSIAFSLEQVHWLARAKCLGRYDWRGRPVRRRGRRAGSGGKAVSVLGNSRSQDAMYRSVVFLKLPSAGELASRTAKVPYLKAPSGVKVDQALGARVVMRISTACQVHPHRFHRGERLLAFAAPNLLGAVRLHEKQGNGCRKMLQYDR